MKISTKQQMLQKLRHPEVQWRVSLTVLLLGSAFIYLFQLAQGQRSEYYAAIPQSMSQNLSNFWFGAIDPGGTVSLDKIPGSYWVPAIFVKVFGFSTWAIEAPNALATIVFVWFVALSGKRLISRSAGLAAGALAAFTPIVAAVARSNQPQSMFLMCLAIASYFGIRALQESSMRKLTWAGVWIGLAFQCYMLVAWALWPALGIAYLFTKQPWAKKVGHLLAAGAISFAVSLIWIVSVWLTPASNRPFVGGTYSNNPWEMVFGYNGLGRFFNGGKSYRSFTPPFSGNPSAVRLLNDNLIAQIGWLIPVAVLVIVALLVVFKKSQSKATDVFLITFFVVYSVMFSAVAGMHQFYTSALAIPISLLVVLGFTRFWHVTWLQVVFLVSALVTSAYISFLFSGYQSWAIYVQYGLATVTAVALFIGVARKGRAWVTVLLAIVVGLAPAAWASDAMNHSSSINPVAGTGELNAAPMQGANPPGNSGSSDSATGNFSSGNSAQGPGNLGQGLYSQDLVTYLQKHRSGAKYLLAVFGAQAAAPFITATGEAVMPIGGFDGSDAAPTLGQFKRMVANGDVRFILIGTNGTTLGNGGPGQGGQSGLGGASSESSKIQKWVTKTCKVVNWSTSSGENGTLYTCS